MRPKFSVITPCLNAEKFIAESIESVIHQKAVVTDACDLEYLICDGGSADGTLAIVRSYIADNQRANISFRLISEKDRGMYDALSKGLKQASGDICAYLNADDFYSLHAFEVVSELFSSKHVKWVTGISAIYNVYSQIVGFKLPFKYRTRFFECGFYGSRLPFVQQESTFWDSSLNCLIDHDRLSGFKLAGDYYLWKQFSESSRLHIVETHLGGFRINPGQLTSRLQDYCDEVKSICRRPGGIDYLFLPVDFVLWKAPPALKKMFNKSDLFRFNHRTLRWE